MSVLIEGYQDNTGLTSLKGTLVPAKTLIKCFKNSSYWKHCYSKEAGEGLFRIVLK